MNKRYVTWAEYQNLVEKLAKRIHSPITRIYGIARGGLIPAVMLSHILDVPVISCLEEPFDWENMCHDNLLIVDDIADSGLTINKFSHFICATVFVNETNCLTYPNYYSECTTDWIVFPYEKEKDTVSGILNTQ